MKINFQQRELCAVNPKEFHWGDTQTAYTALFDLEDGAEIISIEVSQNVNSEDYVCHLIMINKRYNIKIASNGRGFTKRIAIVSAFNKAKIEILNPTLEELNPHPDIYVYQVTPAMEAIAQELGVKRYQIFSAGSDPLR